MSTFKKLRRDEIKRYGRLYFEYIKLFQDHANILRQDPNESQAAYARVTEELKAEFAGSRPASARSISEIHSSLDELERRCRIEARSFDE
jgi:hypothetical protein